MKIRDPFSCDGPGCTQRKQPSNNWWMRDCSVTFFALHKWDDKLADLDMVGGIPQYEHFCSRECSGKSLDKWHAKQATAPAPAPEEMEQGRRD